MNTKNKIKSLEKILDFFPNNKHAKYDLKLYKWSNLFNIELNGSYYPRLNNDMSLFLINEHFYSFYNEFAKKIIVCFEIKNNFLYTNNKNCKYKYKKEWNLIDNLKKCNPLQSYEHNNNIIIAFNLNNGIKALKIYNKFINDLKKGNIK